MSIVKNINVQPGVVKDDTELIASERKNQRRWVDSDRIRFVHGRPQKLGGWTKQEATTFTGICRAMLTWLDNQSNKRIALGTHLKLEVAEGATFSNITPTSSTGQLTNPFDVSSGSPTVTVNHTNNGRNLGDYVEFANASAVGGITPDGNYKIQTLAADGDSYTITHGSNASSTVSGGGGTVDYEYEIPIGLADGTAGTGFGVGPFGKEEWGDARTGGDTIDVLPRTWSIDNFGTFIICNPRGLGLYQWELDIGTRAKVLSNAPINVTAMFTTEEQHVVALGADGNKMLVRWCDQGRSNVWLASSQTTAGSRNLTGGSEVLAGLRTRGTNLLLTDASIWRMTFLGGPGTGIFSFEQMAAGAVGIVGPKAACEVDGVVFWMGRNDFYFYDGLVRRMPNSKDIRRFVFDNLTALQRAKCYCGLNTLFSEIWWGYTDTTEVNRYVKYNYDDRSWDVGTLPRTAMVDRDVFDNPLMCGTDNIIWKHESGNDDVQASSTVAMDEFIVSAPLQLGDGTFEIDIFSVLTDFRDLIGHVNIDILTRQYPQGPQETTRFGPVVASTTKIDGRASGRLIAEKISSGILGSAWRLGTIGFDIGKGGKR